VLVGVKFKYVSLSPSCNFFRSSFYLTFLYRLYPLCLDVRNAVAEDVATVDADAVPEGVIMDGLSADDEKAIDASKESFVFQAEVNRLMDIIINSLCKCAVFIKD
jgi:hypothetical protein